MEGFLFQQIDFVHYTTCAFCIQVSQDRRLLSVNVKLVVMITQVMTCNGQCTRVFITRQGLIFSLWKFPVTNSKQIYEIYEELLPK